MNIATMIVSHAARRILLSSLTPFGLASAVCTTSLLSRRAARIQVKREEGGEEEEEEEEDEETGGVGVEKGAKKEEKKKNIGAGGGGCVVVGVVGRLLILVERNEFGARPSKNEHMHVKTHYRCGKTNVHK